MRPILIFPALLSLAGIVGCSPPAGGPSDPGLAQQVLRAAVRQETAIDSKALADRLLGNPDGLTLIDLRTAEAFGQGRIERAERMEPAGLLSAEFPGERDLVLYDADGSVSAQAVALLRLNGHQRSYYLRGGYAGWSKYLGGEVKDSDKKVEAAREAARRAALACRFEGAYVATAGLVPRVDAGAQTPSGYVPAVRPAAPPPEAVPDALGLGLGLGLGPAQDTRPRGKLKIGEGC